MYVKGSQCIKYGALRRTDREDKLAKATQKTATILHYIALSYVLGDFRANKDGQLRNGESHPKPQVLRDAVEIAIRLGIRYTWIDKMCIKQKDGKRKTRQVSAMYEIYNNVYLTIVDAAGSDSNHGLSEISKRRTGIHPRVNLAGLSWISTLRNTKIMIQQSKRTGLTKRP